MAAHKYIDRICLAGALLSLLLTLLFMNGQALGVQPASRVMGYEAKLFDTSQVHTIDIVMDDWEQFIEICENEEYALCAVVIDNEAYQSIGIRAKGNTSLSTVSQMGSDRYSFKLEFDHYDKGKSYHGLDKLCLNNLIQDNTMMKDYLTYRMMGEFGAKAPLCSYVYLTVNGEDWGLYLAVEGVEDAFLQRNYGRDHGELYKPDSMSFGGGRGNGRDFDMDEFMNRDDGEQADGASGSTQPPKQQGAAPEGFTPPSFGGQFPETGGSGDAPQGGFDPWERFGGGPGGGFGGMGSGDVKLQYTDDNPDSYSNIFDSAKTDVSSADQARLIWALKTLNTGETVEDALDIDQVLRYFVVHNFVVNGDSYTGAMVHNYYLYEKDGRLSMIPWDYNLAFGTFQGSDASEAVNDPIDSPLSVSGNGDRPMADWIFADEAYTALYHQYFEEFLNTVNLDVIIEEARALIAPYVERDPTKFCTTEEFETGVEALTAFCTLRAESVSGQLAGTIPSTDEGQAADNSGLVDASAIALSDLGTMGNGGPGGFLGGEGPDTDAFRPLGSAGPFAPAQPEAEGGEQSEQQSPVGFDLSVFGEGGNGKGQPPGGSAQGEDGGTLILLAASALTLLAGLVTAFRFKGKN